MIKREMRNWVAALGLGGAAMAGTAVANPPAKAAPDGTTTYTLIQKDKQSAIWPTKAKLPAGWKRVGEPARMADLLKNKAFGADPRLVVINHEEQYSVWPKDAARPVEGRVLADGCKIAECERVILKTPLTDTPAKP